MNLEKEIFLVVKEALKFNQATLLENNDFYCLVDDKEAGLFYIGLSGDGCDVLSLIHQGKQIEETVCVISPKETNLEPSDEFHRFLKVRQYTYHGSRFIINAPYKIETMGIKDFAYLSRHYKRNGDDDSYLKAALERGMLKAVNEEGEIMGFIGEHPEHAMGMLYVDEKHRRKGIGTALEKALINKFLDEGKIPFDHVVLGNDKSMNLQHSLNMIPDEGCIFWYF